MIPKNLQKTENEVRLGLVQVNQDPYGRYRGQGAEISINGGEKFGGVYQGLTSQGVLILQPQINYPTCFGKSHQNPIWNNEPVLISYNAVHSFTLRDKEELKRLVVEECAKSGLMDDPSCFI
jgi:hypothetical protein